jgi:LMBR1 domain-containing protein 1
MPVQVYLIGLVAVLGWFFFAIFGGIGMVALPLDLIRAWYFRPRPLDLQQWAREKILLRDRATALIEIGKRIEKEYMGRRDRKYKKVFAKFKTAVYHLENDFSKLRIAYKEKGGSPLKYWSIGLLGFLCAILSFCWFLHIILYMSISPPVSPFLNDLLKASESEFALFGTILYCLFTLHLIMAVIKGNLKFGLRFLFIPIHPMRVGATMMS